MSRPSLDDVFSCPSLPSLPAVAVEVLELTRDENVRLSAIASVVQRDPALAGKILKTVNSSYYGLSRPCPTIMRALTYLGLNTVKALVLGFSLVDLTRTGEHSFDFVAFWQRCLYAAAAARRFASVAGGVDPDEAFTAALMQDIGMLAIQAAIGNGYEAALADAGGDHAALAAAEREHLGFDHVIVGGELAGRWRLPPNVADVIKYQDAPEGATENVALIRTAALATLVVQTVVLADSDGEPDELYRQAKAWCGLERGTVDDVVSQLREDVQQLSHLFKLKLTDPPGILRLLDEARELAVESQIAQQREVESLQRANDTLSRQAATDTLTDVGNRGHFDEELARLDTQARTMRGSLGLLMVDIDHFKKVNDEHGHPAGDTVLVELTERLETVVRDSDVICRYGGEEFAVLLPGTGAKQVAMIAERMRIVVADHPFGKTGSPETIPVTISVGAAVLDPVTSRVITSARALVAAADKALYAAKTSGRDCVRVFTVKERADAA